MNYWLELENSLEEKSDDKLDALLVEPEINLKDPATVAAFVQRAVPLWIRMDEIVYNNLPDSAMDLLSMSLRDATGKVLSVLKKKGMNFEYNILPLEVFDELEPHPSLTEQEDKVTVQLVESLFDIDEKNKCVLKYCFDVKRDTTWLTGKM